jgi:hypothetical protein
VMRASGLAGYAAEEINRAFGLKFVLLCFILGGLHYDVMLVTFGRRVFCLLHVDSE